MAEDLHYASRSDNKRKFDDQGLPASPAVPTSGRRRTGFSAPIGSPSSVTASLSSYSSVPPPPDGIQLAKQRAQEIAARIFSDAEAKRPRVENGGASDDFNIRFFGASMFLTHLPFVEFGFVEVGEGGGDQSHKPIGQSLASESGIPAPFASYGYPASNKKIDIPNGRVGVIIGKSGETIKYLQVQSGARIQVTRDMDADPNLETRPVELIGTPEQISKAERLINDVLAEADAGGSGILTSQKFSNTTNGEHFSMKVPNNKVGLIIGKGGETIKTMQASSGARIQVIPLHLPLGDISTERTVHIDGTTEQIESAKKLVNDVISEHRVRNPQTAGGYHPPRPPVSWAPTCAPPLQQPGYGFMQPGAYPGHSSQYTTSQLTYSGYPPTASTGWDQLSNPAAQQTTLGTGYEYYSQQPVGGSSTPTDGSSYNYNQIPTAYNTQGSYVDSPYSQAGYAQPNPQTSYVQQGYSYGNHVSSASEESGPNYGAQGATQPVPISQGYVNQLSGQAGYSHSVLPAQPGYGQSQVPKLPANPATYGQAASSQGGYSQSPQASSQPPAATSGHGYASPEGYGERAGYLQPQQQSYNDSYAGGGYLQPPYSGDGPSSTPAAASKASPSS
ncbi:hypothetical protein AXF42_Ash011983 [Apostasia shenzhenica]|uniref:K Homology domain-containing protein n=1 Tax=Apostasia shenzhenica TaxID=1088818 RepID=A0A2I0AJH7_9ASPA|nr:hypothetical protein AXF42_Ash011983 [Apostasia shenzhenica]